MSDHEQKLQALRAAIAMGDTSGIINPFLGPASDEVFPGLRRFAKGSHVIYYRRSHE